MGNRKSTMLSGEGLVMTFSGSGKINTTSIKQLDLFSEPGGGNFNFPKNKKETDYIK